MIRCSLCQILAVVVLISSAYAQEGKPSADPFGADPFGGDSRGSDPFAKPRKVVAKPVDRSVKSAAKPVDVAASEKRIRDAMNHSTSISAIELPLAEAIYTLSRQHDIPMVIDRRALEELGLSHEEPVTLDLKNVSLRSVLRLMLRDLDLTYMVKDEVLQITTVDAAESSLSVRVHRLPAELTGDTDLFVRTLMSSVQPQLWGTFGGPCSASFISDRLVVSSTEVGHESVEEFLLKLVNAKDPTANGKAARLP